MISITAQWQHRHALDDIASFSVRRSLRKINPFWVCIGRKFGIESDTDYNGSWTVLLFFVVRQGWGWGWGGGGGGEVKNNPITPHTFRCVAFVCHRLTFFSVPFLLRKNVFIFCLHYRISLLFLFIFYHVTFFLFTFPQVTLFSVHFSSCYSLFVHFCHIA